MPLFEAFFVFFKTFIGLPVQEYKNNNKNYDRFF